MKPVLELLTDSFAARDNALSRVEARVKLVVALVTLGCVVLSTRAVLPLACACAALALVLAVGVPVRFTLARLVPPLGIALVLVVLQAFLTGTTPLCRFSVAGLALTATREGVWHGLLIGSRVLGAVTVMLLLSSVTPAHEIFRALRWLRAPQGWVEVALLTYRYTFFLVEVAGAVSAAQRIRLGYCGFRRSLASASQLSGTVLVRAMDQAVRSHEAMVLRGYRGELPWARRPLGARAWGAMALASSVPLLALLLLELEAAR
ncbi:MAG: cobalt ECF transporter T component CbiQ [Myxococcaceae bacterium]